MINKILNGDSFELLKEFDANTVDMVLTDIPYGEVNGKGSRLRNLEKGIADVFDNDRLEELCDELARVCKGNIYVFCGTKQISDIVTFFEKNKMSVRVGVWNKTNPSPMNGTKLWVSGLEFCVYARKPKSTHNEHCKKAIWEFPVGRSKIHPTQKPTKLFEKLIEASSNEGDLILDPFLGSGTTAIAAINKKRNFIGIEKDENFYNICKERVGAILNGEN